MYNKKAFLQVFKKQGCNLLRFSARRFYQEYFILLVQHNADYVVPGKGKYYG